MHFQFQYSPTDQAVIREVDERIYISPGTTITVWAIGIAVCLLILGIIGAWSVLSWLGTFAAFFVAFYVYVLTRKSHGNRETLVRNLTVDENGIVERYCESEFYRTWSAFQRAYELESHFLFHHYSSVLAIPKRVVQLDRLDEVREIIDRCHPEKSAQALPLYDQVFNETAAFKIHRFTWGDGDLGKIYESKLQPFDRLASRSIPTSKVSSRWVYYWLLFLLVACIGVLVEPRAGFDGVMKLWFIPMALACPFVIGFFWWKYTVKLTRQAPFKFPKEEISVLLSDSHLAVGFPTAVSRYGWEDIKSFVYNKDFIGFVPQNGMIHLISNRAFGGMENALDFLRVADQLRFDASDEAIASSRNGEKADAQETGNPFQSPKA